MTKKITGKECKGLKSEKELYKKLNVLEFRLLATVRLTAFMLMDVSSIREEFKLKESPIPNKEELELMKEAIREVKV